MKTLDCLVGSFKKFDEEHTILTTRYIDCQEVLDNHDKRITMLEKRSSYKVKKI